MEFIGFIVIAIIIALVNASSKKSKTQQARQMPETPTRSPADEQRRAAERLREYQRQRELAMYGQTREDAAGKPGMASNPRPARQPAAAATASPTAAQPTPWRCVCGTDNRAMANFCTGCGAARYGGSGSLRFDSTEGISLSVGNKPIESSLNTTEPESTMRVAGSTMRHTVKPVTESRHSHVESTIAGAEDCHDQLDPVPREVDAYAHGVEETTLPYGLVFNRNAAVQGMLYAEILGKPKALRKTGA